MEKEIIRGGGFNVFNFVLGLLVSIVSGYLALLVKSTKREFADGLKALKDATKEQQRTCWNSFEDIKKDIEKLYSRTESIPGYEARFVAGNDKFHSMEKRIDRLEDKK